MFKTQRHNKSTQTIIKQHLFNYQQTTNNLKSVHKHNEPTTHINFKWETTPNNQQQQTTSGTSGVYWDSSWLLEGLRFMVSGFAHTP